MRRYDAFRGLGARGCGDVDRLSLAGVPIALDVAVALECAVFAMRSAAFPVPSGLGVQEGGYAMIGAFLGVPPETALALALVKRGRDLILANPSYWHGKGSKHYSAAS